MSAGQRWDGWLAERFDVLQMTIRRDLRMLEEQGFLVRTHFHHHGNGRAERIPRSQRTQDDRD